MNKLEDKYIAAGCLFANARKVTEITADIAVKFAEWLLNGNHPFEYNDMFCKGEHRNTWHDDDGSFLTTEEMFTKFINDYYEKR